MAQFHYQVGDGVNTVQVERTGEAFCVSVGNRSYTVRVQSAGAGRLVLQIEEQRMAAVVATAGQRTDLPLYVWLEGEQWTLQRLRIPRRHAPSHNAATDSITAPMPGQVLALLVTAGTHVAQGDPLVVLGAMKMETRIVAPRAGLVAAIGCAEGDTVARGQVLVQLAPSPEPQSNAA